MKNQSMQRKLEDGDAIDVSGFPRTVEGDYILPDYAEGMDYCNRQTEEWIWSIGRSKTGMPMILASTTTKFYGHPDYECLWLR